MNLDDPTYCPITDDHRHAPDIGTLTADHDRFGNCVQVWIVCQACQRNGCLGTVDYENIFWQEGG